MSLESTAQELIVMDPDVGQAHDVIPIIPLEVSLPQEHGPDDIEIEDSGPEDIVIELSDLPGAPPGTQDPQEEAPLEVVDESPAQTEDDNDAKKSKKNEKWDWESKGPHGFVAWIKERIDGVPQHSGYDSAGLERAMSYMDKLDSEISKAMRLDLDGELDANKIEEVRSKIDDGLSRLQQRLDRVKKSKKSRRKKTSESVESGIVKEGQKITGVQGIYIVAPLLISRIARVCINGMVSAGHDIEDLYARQIKKYNLNMREQAEVMQLLSDMGYPLRQDRGFMPDEDFDYANSDNMDWPANYKG